MYTDTCISQSAPAILKAILDVYNPGNRGVDISFEGPDKDYKYLCKVVGAQFPREKIACEHRQTKVAVAGRCSAGKTTLIESLGQKQGGHYMITEGPQYKQYISKSTQSTIDWYEIHGIDFGENIDKVEAAVDELYEQGLTAFVYCFCPGRIEDAEVQLIQNIQMNHPEVTVLGVLTNALSEDEVISSEMVGGALKIKIIPVMAKDTKTRSGVVKAFGLEKVLAALLGGEYGEFN